MHMIEIPVKEVMDYKMCIVVRKDVDMGKGKLAGQVAHAACSAVINGNETLVKFWYEEGQKKVVMKVDSLDELLSAIKEAEQRGLECVLIRDAGKTQLEPGTITCFSCGPFKESEYPNLFKNLKLL